MSLNQAAIFRRLIIQGNFLYSEPNEFMFSSEFLTPNIEAKNGLSFSRSDEHFTLAHDIFPPAKVSVNKILLRRDEIYLFWLVGGG